MKTATAILLIFAFMHLTVPTAFAGQIGGWEDVKSFMNREIAVKSKNKAASFGVLRYADDKEIRVQIAGKQDLTNQEMTFQRTEITKIQQAELRYGESNIGKGALIGGAVGAGIGVIGGATAKEADPLNYVGVPLFGLIGAGVGSLVGVFSKKNHKKGVVIYQV